MAANAILFPMNPGQCGLDQLQQAVGRGILASHVVRMATYPNGAKQILARDACRVLFWNNYDQASVVSGATADGVIYQPDLFTNVPNAGAPEHIADIDFDAQGRVYIAVADRIDMFQGPFVTGAAAIRRCTCRTFRSRSTRGRPGRSTSPASPIRRRRARCGSPTTPTTASSGSSNPFTANASVDLAIGQRGANNRRAQPNRDRDDGIRIDCLSVQPDSFSAWASSASTSSATCT